MRFLVLPVVPVLVLAAGCGKKGDSNPTAGGTTTGTGTPWTGPTTGDSKTETGDTGKGTTTVTIYKGDADVDLANLTWSGTETAEVSDSSSGALFCQWTWTTTDWAHDTTATGAEPTAPACTDGDGNACTFAFTVNLTAGAQTSGDCTTYTFDVAGGAFHYGYVDDWISGGTSLGPQFTYYAGNGSTGDWFPAFEIGYGSFIWTPGTAQDGQLHYELERTLLDSYSTP